MKNFFLFLIGLTLLASCSSDDSIINPVDNSNNPDDTNPDSSGSTNFNWNSCELGQWSIASNYADFDNDGDTDIIMLGQGNSGASGIILYENNSNSSYSESLLTSFNMNLSAVVMADIELKDLDDDGDIDILYTAVKETTNGATRIHDGCDFGWFENISGVFTQHSLKFYSGTSTLPNYGLATNLVSADFDNDGDIDILNSNMDLFINDGSQNFTLQSVYANFVKQMELYDFDDDGDMDILTHDYQWSDSAPTWSDTGASAILINNGGNSFTLKGFPISGSVGELADFNNDGYLDLISGFRKQQTFDSPPYEYKPAFKILLSNNDFITNDNYQTIEVVLDSYSDYALYMAITDIKAFDIDNDSDLDLVMGGFGGMSVSYNTNNGTEWTHEFKFLGDNGDVDRVTSFSVDNFDGDSDMELFVNQSSRKPIVINSSVCY